MNLKIPNSVIIVEHEANDVGPGHVLIQYFNKRKIDELVYIGHPNLYIKSGFKKSSRVICFRDGTLVWEKTGLHWILPEWALYIKDVVYTIFWVICLRKKYDVFIGLGNINAFCGCLLKLLGKAHRTIYYVIDYVPQRFTNPIMNWIYHTVDKFAADHSDSTWNLSPRMIEGREQRWHKKFSNQLVVPHGLYYDKNKFLPFNKINKHEIIYMGHLNAEQGIQLIIEALPEIAKKIPDISFTLIGTGNYEKDLKAMAKRLAVDKMVHFLGLIRDTQKMEKRLAKGAIAVALYNPNHGFSYYSDPGKIKHYLSVGLPIVMTDMPYVASIIRKNKCGLIACYGIPDIVDKITDLINDSTSLKIFRENSHRLAKLYDWDTLLNQSFSSLWNQK